MGLSYLGFVQWAIAPDVPELKAMSIQVSSAEFRNPIYSGEAFSLEIALTWIHLMANQEHTNLLKQILFPASRTLRAIFPHLPLRESDTLTGSCATYQPAHLDQEGLSVCNTHQEVSLFAIQEVSLFAIDATRKR